jgi:hypothetical protein
VPEFLGRIERLLEDAVEGTSRRLFRARLQPVQLAKAASRAMEEQRVIGPYGPEVPNHYRILLHPSDFAQFAGYRRSLEANTEQYLERFAADRGLRPVADWRVELQTDESVRPRAVRVEARMADIEDLSTEGTPPTAAAVEGTAPLQPARDPGPPAPPTLLAEDGRRFPLSGEVTSLGRALDNDVVIGDSRVSRHHAEIRRADAGYAVRDVGSRNGTAVAGRRVTEQRLRDGDEISLGGFIVVVHLGDG